MDGSGEREMDDDDEREKERKRERVIYEETNEEDDNPNMSVRDDGIAEASWTNGEAGQRRRCLQAASSVTLQASCRNHT